jgi:hypothetical protein
MILIEMKEVRNLYYKNIWIIFMTFMKKTYVLMTNYLFMYIVLL